MLLYSFAHWRWNNAQLSIMHQKDCSSRTRPLSWMSAAGGRSRGRPVRHFSWRLKNAVSLDCQPTFHSSKNICVYILGCNSHPSTFLPAETNLFSWKKCPHHYHYVSTLDTKDYSQNASVFSLHKCLSVRVINHTQPRLGRFESFQGIPTASFLQLRPSKVSHK